MANGSKESLSCQVQHQLSDLESSSGLPFRELLSEDKIAMVIDGQSIKFRDRVFSPRVTLWAFLSQVIARKDSSCDEAVSRVNADRVAHRKKACSTKNSSYCAARQRLPEKVIMRLTRETGQELHAQAEEEWLWHNRPVKIVDGSTVTMADTRENQEEYPQSKSQKKGLGFPILRFVVLLSLA